MKLGPHVGLHPLDPRLHLAPHVTPSAAFCVVGQGVAVRVLGCGGAGVNVFAVGEDIPVL